MNGHSNGSQTASVQKAALYVNRGLGTLGFPVRIGVPPEITLLTLRRA
jgi:predicted MPP superfamily phosphohydrolase